MEDEVKIQRSQFATCLNTGTLAAKVYNRIGKGVTGQTVAYNPNVTTEQYIDEDSATNSVDSYAPNIPTPQTAYVGNPVFDFVDNIRRTRGIGAKADTTMLMVYVYDEQTEGVYGAEENNCTIQIDDFGGDAGAPTVINYTILLNGDPKLGTATINKATKTATFTPEVA